MLFAEQLKTARKSAFLTQKSMSEITGIPKPTIEQWERDIATPPEYVQRYVLNHLEQIRQDSTP